MTDRLSVVIPLYNKEKSIQSTIQSVLAQTYADFELIIVDDGSTDSSLSIVKEFTDHRIRILEKENGGVSSARNAGILAAKNDFIAMLDADDFWRNNHLFVLSNLVKNYTSPKVACYGTRFVKRHQYKAHLKTSKPHEVIIIDDYFSESSKPQNLQHSSTILLKKEIAQLAGLYDENLTHGEDVEFYCRLFELGSLVISNEETVIYETKAENRSDVSVPLLKTRFHKFDYKNASTSKQRYYDKLVCLLLIDYIQKRAFTIAVQVVWLYPMRLPFASIYFFKLCWRKIYRTFRYR